MMVVVLLCLYLGTIVAANVLVAKVGPAAIGPVSFVLIGADMVIRDMLHQKWQQGLGRRLALLVLAGSALSALFADTQTVALASGVAFAVAFTVDAILYQLLLRTSWLERSMRSNAVSAFFDSVLFPTIAFGQFMPALIMLNYVYKVCGSLFWAVAVKPLMEARDQ